MAIPVVENLRLAVVVLPDDEAVVGATVAVKPEPMIVVCVSINYAFNIGLEISTVNDVPGWAPLFVQRFRYVSRNRIKCHINTCSLNNDIKSVSDES